MAKTRGSRIYVSYAWKSASEEIVQRLEAACEKRGTEILIDRKAIKYGDSIRNYMRDLGAGDAIVVVLSDDYLKSHNCMFELLEIQKYGEIHQRVFPLVLAGTTIYNPEDRIDYVRYWEQKTRALEEKLNGLDNQRHTTAIQDDLNLYSDIRRGVDQLMDILRDMNALTKEVHIQTDFGSLIGLILNRLSVSVAKNEKGKRVPVAC